MAGDLGEGADWAAVVAKGGVEKEEVEMVAEGCIKHPNFNPDSCTAKNIKLN